MSRNSPGWREPRPSSSAAPPAQRPRRPARAGIRREADMTWVRMKDHISGGRHDGRDWPPANGTIDVPDWEAQDLIRGGHAVSAPGEGKGTPVPPEPAAPAAAETEPEAAA